MLRRTAGTAAIALILPVVAGLSFERFVNRASAAQPSPTATSVYFKSTTEKAFRKIVVRFDITGTVSNFTAGEATCGNEKFKAGTPAKSVANGKTYFAVVYESKTPPAGDSPMSSGSLASISFTITIDNNPVTVPSMAPVIDIDPCATR